VNNTTYASDPASYRRECCNSRVRPYLTARGRETMPQSARHERAKFSLSRVWNPDSASPDRLRVVGWHELDRPHPWVAVVAPDAIENPCVSLDS